MPGFVSPSSFPLLCLCSARLLFFFPPWMGQHARTRTSGSGLYELSQFCWHTHFFLPANPMCAIAWLRNTSRRKTQTKTSIIPRLLTSWVFLHNHPVLASFKCDPTLYVEKQNVLFGPKVLTWSITIITVDWGEFFFCRQTWKTTFARLLRNSVTTWWT